jgi:hypothetical protein
MYSLLEPAKGAASYERAIGSLRDRTGALLVEFRRLFAQEFSRLELRAKVRSYLSVLRVPDVRAILPRKAAVAKGRSRMTTSLYDPVAVVRLKRFVDELEQQWRERPRGRYRRLARGYSGESKKLLSSAIDYFVPKFTNATRMLKEQLTAEGVTVWVTASCLKEFAEISSVAAARTRQADETYNACLRREIVTRARFIREWTRSDKKFDQTQWGELVSVARKYALPRSWTLFETVASVRGHTVAGRIPAQGEVLRQNLTRADRAHFVLEAHTLNCLSDSQLSLRPRVPRGSGGSRCATDH